MECRIPNMFYGDGSLYDFWGAQGTGDPLEDHTGPVTLEGQAT